MEHITNILIALIVALPGLLAWRTSKRNSSSISKNTNQTVKNAEAIHEVHLSINSRLDKFIEASNALSKKEGIEEGIEIGRGEPQDKEKM